MPAEADETQTVRLSLPLKYQQDIFEELRADDELVILARGLGVLRLVTNLLYSYDAAGNNLVILLNADAHENKWIGEALAEHMALDGSTKARNLREVNTDEMSIERRQQLYQEGGILSVTSQILVVDLLLRLLHPESVTGLILLHADRVTATSLESFILRVFRRGNKVGFLKAFSDNPEQFSMGFSPLRTMMRNLFLKKVSLWPRFHVHVSEALEGKKKAEVIELEVPMSDDMREIQAAIMECVEVSIGHLKKTNTGLDMEDWNLDSALHRNFDAIVRRQLDPVWHRLTWETKGIVGDLTVLRDLLTYLLTYDAVSFNKHLDIIRADSAPTPGSTYFRHPWLYTDAANTIFETAKRRVYTGKADETLRPTLEEQPKWALLAEVLEEIETDLYLNPALRDDSNGTILVMCSDLKTSRQIRQYIETMYVKPPAEDGEGEDKREPSASFMMRRYLRNYLRWKEEFPKSRASLIAEGKAVSTTAVYKTGSPSVRGGKAPSNKRRRVRGGSSAASTPGRSANGSSMGEDGPQSVSTLLSWVQLTEQEGEQKEDIIMDPLDNMDDYYQLYDMKDLLVVHAYAGDMDEHLLEEVRPRYVIMYEPDAAFVRRVEVYRSSHNDRNVRVYFMYYGNSVEEQRYLSSVRREKDAFERLIKEKATMPLHLTVDAHGGEDPQEAFLRTVNTRVAGGGRLVATAVPPRVIVDKREFRASLASLLDARNIMIVPAQLTVGDYILSPEICVERKSISDLVGSFANGRLYNQIETMFRYYKSPVLLIEFDQNGSFTLEPYADYSKGNLNAANVPTDLQSKLVLLTLAFPRLRIVWSSSPYQSSEIFEVLKVQQDEPDPILASRIGLDKEMNAANQVFNQDPQDMLAAVPGITAKNIKNVVLQTETVQQISNMEIEDLDPLIGIEAARKVYGFFNKNLLFDEDG